jgi:hypothetical protein
MKKNVKKNLLKFDFQNRRFLYHLSHDQLLPFFLLLLAAQLDRRSTLGRLAKKKEVSLLSIPNQELPHLTTRGRPEEIPRWWLEGGSRKCASYCEILERHWRHTLQAKPPRRGKI